MLKYWIWLSTRQNVSGAQAIALLSRFGSAVAIYQADEEALKRGSDAPVPPSLLDKSLTGAEVILQQCYQKNIHVMTIQDAQYPARLRSIDDPPIVLYYKGVFPAIDTSPVIAMVGTRKASAYGLMQAKRLGYQVAKCGGMVVSGGAEGIDTMCLTGALSANRPVIAVLGCGVDVVYPAENALRLPFRAIPGLGDIAAAVGYENFSYFYRRFRQLYGCSPNRYRQLYDQRQPDGRNRRGMPADM